MMARRHGPIPGHRPRQRVGLPTVPLPPEWTRRAVCTPQQADRLFYADPDDPDETNPAAADARRAKAQTVCAACPMRAACRREAQQVDALHGYHGVWAGQTNLERKPVKPKPVHPRVLRRRADTRPPVAELSEAAFDADVLRLADQGVNARTIAERLNRSIRDVELSRKRAQDRRRRAARRTQRHASQTERVAA